MIMIVFFLWCDQIIMAEKVPLVTESFAIHDSIPRDRGYFKAFVNSRGAGGEKFLCNLEVCQIFGGRGRDE
ncbi:hypothetical protein BDV95DRAFT_583054 [Massariosphaeria phaeospora]|uniref:Uncharacterized protein n=1 Tax=Massariosphaeria phaeospora TaxID=100035 RepID=A0A7C8M666_9PLEO|nr:hypothetical protein BDV95DRAFT_583054 [Massariosphaeria phaeospora]